MKIAITFLTFGLDCFGGIERATFFLACGLVDCGCETVVITSQAYADGSSIDGIRVAVMEGLPSTFDGGDGHLHELIASRQGMLSSEFLNILDREQPNYVLVVDPLWGFAPLLNIWTQIDVPVGLIFHVSHPEEVLNTVGTMPFRHLFAVSQTLRQELQAQSSVLSKRPIKILPNCLHRGHFFCRPTEKADAIFGNARLSREKGTTDLIAAFARIKALHPELVLWLCDGDFPFGDRMPGRHEAEVTIRSLGLEGQTQFLPRLRWKEIPARIAAARVVVLPSYKETFGMAALEAMAAGTPLVVSRAGNLPWLVDGAAMLVEPGDVDGIAKAMRRTLEDDDLRISNVERGRARSAEYDAVVVAGRLIEFLQESNSE
jgi:glycosyltransferase involved in cell wall biosynthesis